MVVLTKGQKRALESSSDDQSVLKKIKLVAWDSEDKEQFKKDFKGSCYNFAETGECTFGEECRFNHVTRDGELVQEAKVKTKTKKKKTTKKKSKKKTQTKVIRKTKEECIAEREIDEDDNIYTGTVKFFNKRGYGFISIEEDITFKNLTATKKIYVMKEDIICESDEMGLNKDEKVMFKVYKDSMGLGAMDVLNEDGSPIVFEVEAVEGEKEEVVEKEPTPEPVKPKKTVTKKKSSKSAKKKKAVKKTTKTVKKTTKTVKKTTKAVKKTTKKKAKRSKKN